MPLEFDILCRAVAAALPAAGDRTLDGADVVGAGDVDWPAVLQAACNHRVLRPVAAALNGLPPGTVPPEALARLNAMERQLLLRSVGQVAETLRLNRLLSDAGIRVLTFKGVLLSRQLYGDPFWRGPGDIDLLVDPASFAAAQSLLVEAGYRAVGRAVAPGAQWTVRDRQFQHSQGILVELHQRLTANPHQFQTDFDGLWADRALVDLGGTMLPTLPDRILPVYLALHGYHHCWGRLCWVADLAVLCSTPQRAEEALAAARAAGVGEAMLIGLHLATRWLGMPPAEVAAVAQAASRGDTFIRHFFSGQGWLTVPDRGTPRWLVRELRRRRNRYLLAPSWRGRWREVRADLFNPIDHDVLALPARLWWLYPLLRPVGWVLRNFGRRPAAGQRRVDGAPFPTVDVLGTAVHALRFSEALAFAEGAVRQRSPVTVCHVNVHTVVEALEDGDLRDAFAGASLRAADGMPLVWLGRARGQPAERVYGPDFMRAVLGAAGQWVEDRPSRHFLYGSTPEVLARLSAHIAACYPRAEVVGMLSPPFRPLSEAEERDDAQAIDAARPDVLWVGLGAPRQEKWMARNRPRLQVPLIAGVGAAFDFLAGVKPQAPRWMQRAGLEWLFRLGTEPSRLAGRYLRTMPRFVGLLALAAVRSPFRQTGR
ncbi:WecB/TagA/CpsF family glycosyltransferase [Novispirillum sp. DQ9]|uniref:WecB/TagA/CpsF family glycosyltransferase n=1 Tax=Novispirillum sp. DQ9 TaxID=3398612 RepID=UPI003C7BF8D2